MWLLHRKIEEKWTFFIFPLSDILLGFDQKMVCHILIYPFGFFSSFHKTDPGDTVDNAVVMSMVPFHFDQFRIVQTCRFTFKVFVVIHQNGIIGFQPGTGGTEGVGYLRKMLDTVLFPELWRVRSTL